jgi:hypothetical protein
MEPIGSTGALTRSVAGIPNVPAVYALLSGEGASACVAYVGVADKLRQRLVQHLVLRNSSVTTGQSAVRLDPGRITEVHWWCHPAFAERSGLEAAEICAFPVLNPTLRSRGAVRGDAQALADIATFEDEMRALFLGAPTGRFRPYTLTEAMQRIDDLETRLAALERRLDKG